MDPFDKGTRVAEIPKTFRGKTTQDGEGQRRKGEGLTMKWKTRIVIRGRTLATFILSDSWNRFVKLLSLLPESCLADNVPLRRVRRTPISFVLLPSPSNRILPYANFETVHSSLQANLFEAIDGQDT